MSAAALGVVVASSLCWAALDALRKRLAAALPPAVAAALLAAGQAPLFALWATLAGDWRLEPGYAVPGAATVVLNAAAIFLFFAALRVSPLSVTIPMLSLTPAFASLLSLLILGEHPQPRQWAGIALVVAGALAVNVRTAGGLALGRERGSLYMTGVALLWSLTAVLDKWALGFASVPTHAAVQSAAVGACLVLPVLRRPAPGAVAGVRAVRGTLVLALVVAGLALGLQLVALRLTLVGVVEAVKRAVGRLAAVIVGRVAFGEPVTPGKLGGIAAMGIGIALLTL